MSTAYCSHCLERFQDCQCDEAYPHIFGEHRVNEIKARRDERKAVLAELEGWLVDEENEHQGHEIDDFYCIQCGEFIGDGKQHPMETFGRNQLRAELRAKLEEMGGVQ